jgi:uncharacterized protein DUF1345
MAVHDTAPESRIFPACTILGLVTILAALPGRYRLFPPWFDIAIGAALATTLLLAGFAAGASVWRRLEPYTVTAFGILVSALEIIVLAQLLYDMASRRQTVGAVSLLTTAVGVWITNVVIFALIYWELDRGGPAGRSTNWKGRRDFGFPRGEPDDGVPPSWQPAFADYLFLAFTASTAFSPTDVLPLTPRAKMLIMAQSLIALVTVVAVAARAINILGT